MLVCVYGVCKGCITLSFVDYFDNLDGAFDCFIRREKTKRSNETVYLSFK